MHRLALSLLLLLPLACGGVSKKNTEKPEPPPLSEQAYTHYLRGQLAFFRGDFTEAQTELKAAKRVAPDQAPIARALAEAHYNAGNRRAAESETSWALKQWPNDAQVWKLSGSLHTRARDFSAAATALKRAIALGAKADETYLAYAHSLVQIGKRSSAKTIYRKIVAREEGSAEGHYQLALLLHREANHRAAARHAERATTQAPYDLRAWALLASALRAQGRHDEAADALRRPFDRSRGDSGVGQKLFVELLDLGARDHAMASVAILDRDDLSIDTRIAMGHWLLRAGDFQGALAVAGNLGKTTLATAAIAELRVRALRALGREREAVGQLETIGEDDPGYPLMRSMLAQLRADRGDIEGARDALASVLKSSPDNPDVVMAQAAVAESAGDINRARDILSAAIARHPDAQRPLFALAEVEARNGRPGQAIATIAPMLRANPRSFAALNYIGYTLLTDPAARERARDLLLRALELAPDSAFVLDSYGWYLLKSGDHKGAAPLIERALRLTPTEPELILHLAELRWLEGRQEEADRLLKEALSLALGTHTKQAARAVQKRLSRQLPPAKP